MLQETGEKWRKLVMEYSNYLFTLHRLEELGMYERPVFVLLENSSYIFFLFLYHELDWLVKSFTTRLISYFIYLPRNWLINFFNTKLIN